MTQNKINMHKDKRMASFRLKNETIAKLNFLIDERLANSKTEFIEHYIDMYYQEYIKAEDIEDAIAINKGFQIMLNDTKADSVEHALNNKKLIREMEIQRAKEQYAKLTNTKSEAAIDETVRLFGQSLEEFLIDQGMLKEWIMCNYVNSTKRLSSTAKYYIIKVRKGRY